MTSSISPRSNRPKAAPSAEESSTIFAMLDSWGNIRRCRLLIWRHRLCCTHHHLHHFLLRCPCYRYDRLAETDLCTQGPRQLVGFIRYPSTFFLLHSRSVPYPGQVKRDETMQQLFCDDRIPWTGGASGAVWRLHFLQQSTILF